MTENPDTRSRSRPVSSPSVSSAAFVSSPSAQLAMLASRLPTTSSEPQFIANEPLVVPHQQSDVQLPPINELLSALTESPDPPFDRPDQASRAYNYARYPAPAAGTSLPSGPLHHPPASPPYPPFRADSLPRHPLPAPVSPTSPSDTIALPPLRQSRDRHIASLPMHQAPRSPEYSRHHPNRLVAVESSPAIPATTYTPTFKRRGNLPRHVTEILRTWLTDHIHYPYPTEAEKQDLMQQTNLSLNQVSNWFINARRRRVPSLYRGAMANAAVSSSPENAEATVVSAPSSSAPSAAVAPLAPPLAPAPETPTTSAAPQLQPEPRYNA